MAISKVPTRKGSKYPDVHSWTVFFWQDGRVWLCREPLKTESPAPCGLPFIRMHFGLHNDMWEEIK